MTTSVSSRLSATDPVRAFEERTGKKVFDALVEYPCSFDIKIIGRKDDTFVDDMVASIARVTKTPATELQHRTNPSSKGTFISVTISAPVDDAKMLYECYAVLRNDPRVRVAL